MYRRTALLVLVSMTALSPLAVADETVTWESDVACFPQGPGITTNPALPARVTWAKCNVTAHVPSP